MIAAIAVVRDARNTWPGDRRAQGRVRGARSAPECCIKDTHPVTGFFPIAMNAASFRVAGDLLSAGNSDTSLAIQRLARHPVTHLWA